MGQWRQLAFKTLNFGLVIDDQIFLLTNYFCLMSHVSNVYCSLVGSCVIYYLIFNIKMDISHDLTWICILFRSWCLVYWGRTWCIFCPSGMGSRQLLFHGVPSFRFSLLSYVTLIACSNLWLTWKTKLTPLFDKAIRLKWTSVCSFAHLLKSASAFCRPRFFLHRFLGSWWPGS